MTPLPRILLALNLASVIPVANRAEAQTAAHDDNLEHVVEYGATIADVDRVSSTGQQLSDIATSDGAPADKVASSSPRQRRPFHEFPQGFQGRWAYTAADCRAGTSPAPLTIDARGLNQAEGSLVVISILQARDNPGQISVNAHNSGGGEEWDSQEEFTLSKDGQVIEWQRLEPDPGPVTRLYRCKQGP
ncbi:hypothetical protein [Bradyrhizobium iriomotense]|uniref:hypothetical protein n=1 Tax=Bradyrhizobium iriomotense TaxID=441950 RepID=UPI001B89E623|nr:hypothetical protein [Bradyrhizobium iriomotense]MBR0781079.1 hypothetical protein [Bradyrhizobium iriomotense]